MIRGFTMSKSKKTNNIPIAERWKDGSIGIVTSKRTKGKSGKSKK